jgi:hypothetical protein
MNTNRVEETRESLGFFSRWLLIILAAITGAGALWRMFAQDTAILARLDATTLTYLGVAAVLLLLREVKSLAFGDYKVEFERTRQLAAEAKITAVNAQAAALGAGGRESTTKETAVRVQPQPGSVPDDPWNGQFGEQSVRGNRHLEATVTRVSDGVNTFAVTAQPGAAA